MAYGSGNLDTEWLIHPSRRTLGVGGSTEDAGYPWVDLWFDNGERCYSMDPQQVDDLITMLEFYKRRAVLARETTKKSQR